MLTSTKTILAIVIVLGTASAALARGGGVITKCDLSGINPALHKAVFRNAQSAAKYGFVKGPDGNWQVDPKLCGH